MTYQPFEQFSNGSFLEGAINVYDLSLGGVGLAFMFIWLIIVMAVAIKTRNVTSIGIASLLTVVVMQNRIPVTYQAILYGVTLVVFSITLIKFFIDRRRV